ncbi:MAG TPA: T9SS type A sorting domain-containing protein [Bacteroidia bacterium]|nr:T9SS type A sorting domain-containing protein [Bacteroidia bacterium]
MRKNLLISSIFLLGIASISLDILDDNGKAGKTGSPGETTCNTPLCHTGNSANAVGGSITIDCPNMPNWKYTPGQSYTVNVTVERNGLNLFGMGFEALTSTGTNAGSFTITNPNQMTTKSAMISGNSRTSVVHNLNGGASSNSHTFSFTWNAPSTDIGSITFYVAGNAANGDGEKTGDFIYNTSKVISSPTTGREYLNEKKAMCCIYPNPAKDMVNMQYTLKSNSNVTIKIFSLSGQLVLQQSWANKNAGKHQQLIDFNNEINKGVYFVEIEFDQQMFTQKLICN